MSQSAFTGTPKEEAAGSLVGRVFACSPELAGHIVRCGHLSRFQRKTTILRQGDWLALAYLLIAGHAQAVLYGADGQVILLHEFRPGDLFGAVGELDTVRQDANVVAVEDVAALVLKAVELTRLAEQHSVIGLALSRMLMARLRQTTSRMYERAVLSSAGRVYAELLREARRSPDWRITPAPILSEVALRVSTTRETASRAVNALERRGIIRRDAVSLTVVAPDRLEHLIV